MISLRGSSGPPEARLKGCRPCPHPYVTSSPALSRCWKLLTTSSRVGTHSFQGRSPLCAPLTGKAIKLFFATSPNTLSLRFTLAAVHRGQAFGINKSSHGKELRPGNGGKSIYHKVNLLPSYLLPMNWYHRDYGQALKVIFSVCPGSEVIGGPCPWEWVCELQKEVLMLLARLTFTLGFLPMSSLLLPLPFIICPCRNSTMRYS